MERFGGLRNGWERPDWYDQIDWDSSDTKRQVSMLYADTCDQFKDRPNFESVFYHLTKECAEKHPGPEGDKIFAEWMITRLRKEFLGRA
jgi:hypothetical protein